jgi:hypothetical protein
MTLSMDEKVDLNVVYDCTMQPSTTKIAGLERKLGRGHELKPSHSSDLEPRADIVQMRMQVLKAHQ